MDRRGHILLRCLPQWLVGLMLAGLPGLAVCAAARPSAAEKPSVRIVLLPKSPARTEEAGESTPRLALRVGPRAVEASPPKDRISIVLGGSDSPGGQHTAGKPTDGVRITLRQAPWRPAPDGASVVATPKMRMSLTVEPADPFAALSPGAAADVAADVPPDVAADMRPDVSADVPPDAPADVWAERPTLALRSPPAVAEFTPPMELDYRSLLEQYRSLLDPVTDPRLGETTPEMQMSGEAESADTSVEQPSESLPGAETAGDFPPAAAPGYQSPFAQYRSLYEPDTDPPPEETAPEMQRSGEVEPVDTSVEQPSDPLPAAEAGGDFPPPAAPEFESPFAQYRSLFEPYTDPRLDETTPEMQMSGEVEPADTSVEQPSDLLPAAEAASGFPPPAAPEFESPFAQYRSLFEPYTDPPPDETASRMQTSVTLERSEASVDRPAKPLVPPIPYGQPEPWQDGVAGADPAEPPDRADTALPEDPRTFQRPGGSLLLPPEVPTRRSEQLEHIARQADRQIRRGFELASRGAYFAARSEFIKALRLVSQGLDAEHQTTIHSRSLAVGLRAIKEAEDFIPSGSRLEADLDIPGIIDGHLTPVLKNAGTENLTPLVAVKCYFTFAQEQLAMAAGREVAGSMALHALGKLHGASARQARSDLPAAEPKAIAFYQAALLADPHNYMAANDLGVLLARCGDYRQAEATLKHSLSIHQQAIGWHNLAVVYRRLGQVTLAQRADRLAEAAQRSEVARKKATQNPSSRLVRWVDPEAFSQARAKTASVPLATPARPEPAKATGSRQPTQAVQRPTIGWLPWGLEQKGR